MSYWETKTLAEMTTVEWESLCDNCGKCCLHKLEDEDTGDIAITRVVCNLINIETCRCTRYQDRCTLVPECLDLKQHDFAQYNWLPNTCAYRLLTIGEKLPAWHPLISGTQASVKKAGHSIQSFAIKEEAVDDMEDYIIDWIINKK